MIRWALLIVGTALVSTVLWQEHVSPLGIILVWIGIMFLDGTVRKHAQWFIEWRREKRERRVAERWAELRSDLRESIGRDKEKPS